MKKIILTAIAVTTLTIYSCKKTAVMPTGATPVSSIVENDDDVVMQKAGPINEWFDNGKQPGQDDVDYGCWADPLNCFGTYVLVDNGIGHVMGVITTGTNDEIINVFEADYATISTIVAEEYIDGVISGDLTVSVRGTDPAEKRYLKFWDVANNEMEIVYPITIE